MDKTIRLTLIFICLLSVIVTTKGKCTTTSHIDSEKQFCKFRMKTKIAVGETRTYYRRACMTCTCTEIGMECCGIGWKADDVEVREGYELVKKLRGCRYKYVPIIVDEPSPVADDNQDGSILVPPEDNPLIIDDFNLW